MEKGRCTKCGSYAINQHLHGRENGIDLDLCDVCYWRKRAELPFLVPKKVAVQVLEEMCVESLNPDLYGEWEYIKNYLKEVRTDL